MKKLFLGVLLATTLGAQAYAVTVGDLTWSGYGRSNFQIGDNGAAGEVLWNGFGFHPRLQETQYFESSLIAKLPEDAIFDLQLSEGGPTWYYTNLFGTDIAIRDFYLKVNKVAGIEDFSLWAGDYTYRGMYMELWDSWAFDDQNLMGAGMHYGKDFEIEFAVGVKQDMAYESSALTDDNAAQRIIAINKLIYHLNSTQYLKTNIEYQSINSTEATLGGPTPQTIEVPSSSGVRAGLQHTLQMATGENNVFVTWANGDIISGDYAFNTMSVPVNTLTTSTGQTLTGVGATMRQGSALIVGLEGHQRLENYGFIYNCAYFDEKDQDDNLDLQQIAFSVRPLYYVNKFLNAGAEFDYIHFNNANAGDSYFEIAPMLEYTLDEKDRSCPKFKLIYAWAHYQDPLMKYGKSVTSAGNLTAGIEVSW